MPFFSRFDRYLARLIATPLFSTLILAAMLLLLDRMLKLFNFVINEGGPVSVVWRMLGNTIPQYLGLGIPIGVLLGTLLAFRKLALSSELDALRAVGVGYTRLLFIPYVYAAALSLVTLIIVGFVQPYSRYAYEGLQYELRSGALGASIQVGEFAKLGKKTTLRVEESHDDGRRLDGVFVRSEAKDSTSVSVTAKHGQFLATDDPDVILLRLRDGVLVQDSPKFTQPRVLFFQQHDLPVDLPTIEAFRARGDENLEQTLPELVRVGVDPKATPDARRKSAANFQRRLVQVIVVFVLPLLGVALAVPPKRSTSALGVFLSLVILIVYNEVSEWAEKSGGAGKHNLYLIQWLPFVLFTALCCWLYYVLAFKPGGQPISALEKVFASISKFVVRIVRGARKPRKPALSAG